MRSVSFLFFWMILITGRSRRVSLQLIFADPLSARTCDLCPLPLCMTLCPGTVGFHPLGVGRIDQGHAFTKGRGILFAAILMIRSLTRAPPVICHAVCHLLLWISYSSLGERLVVRIPHAVISFDRGTSLLEAHLVCRSRAASARFPVLLRTLLPLVLEVGDGVNAFRGSGRLGKCVIFMLEG